MTTLSGPRALALAAILAGTTALPAAAQEFTAPNGDKVTFYGQLNFAYQGFDDGEHTDNTFSNAGNSTSRLGFTYDHDTSIGALRFQFETSLGFASTSTYSQRNDDPDYLDWQKTNLRKVELSLTNSYGKFTLGQGSMSTDGVGEIDLSGTSVAGTASFPDVAGNYFLRNKDGSLSDVSISDVFHDTDGPRRFRLRYDTPTFGGFSWSASYGTEVLAENNNNDYYDTALNWKGDLGDFKVQAGVGAAWTDYEDKDRGTQGQSVASLSVLHSSGVSLGLGAGEVYGDNGDWQYAKLGYQTKDWISAGTTAIAVEYMKTSDFGNEDGRGHSVGVMATQTVDSLKTDFYVGYREYRYSDADASYQDAKSLLAGARWKF